MFTFSEDCSLKPQELISHKIIETKEMTKGANQLLKIRVKILVSTFRQDFYYPETNPPPSLPCPQQFFHVVRLTNAQYPGAVWPLPQSTGGSRLGLQLLLEHNGRERSDTEAENQVPLPGMSGQPVHRPLLPKIPRSHRQGKSSGCLLLCGR